MDKSTKKKKKIFFHCLAHLDLENFLIRVWGGGGVCVCVCVWKITPEPKMQEMPDPPPTTTPKLNSTFLDLEKWLFMPEICDDILLLLVGNYSLNYLQPYYKQYVFVRRLSFLPNQLL